MNKTITENKADFNCDYFGVSPNFGFKDTLILPKKLIKYERKKMFKRIKRWYYRIFKKKAYMFYKGYVKFHVISTAPKVNGTCMLCTPINNNEVVAISRQYKVASHNPKTGKIVLKYIGALK